MEEPMDAAGSGQETRVVVCNERKALIMENVGTARRPQLRLRAVLEASDSTAGPSAIRARRESLSEAETIFLGDLALELDRRAAGTRVGYVLVAPARVRVRLHALASPRLLGAMGAEIEGDYASLPVTAIEPLLSARSAAIDSAA
jgi:hypothetical protein